MTLSIRSILSVLLSGALPLVGCGDPGPDDVAVGSATPAAPGSPAATGSAVAPLKDSEGCGMGKGHRMKGPVTLSEAPEWLRDKLSGADSNKDGVVSVEEGKAARRARRAAFEARADSNKDGTISEDERRAAFRADAERRFTDADKNRDLALTKDEVGDHRWTFVARADANGDGRVAKAELEEAFKAGKLGFRGKMHHRMWKTLPEATDTTAL